ncbi:hypothetical protein [Flocculibacter collagenilyticus]|uniref:hypothetical protein n=1 Tax=Flocculibacter collagenilyticus TaxID=2744479 RepID=UPI0018F44A89|nr:hypothetical protein [Flocculibacter collagenilyticus]
MSNTQNYTSLGQLVGQRILMLLLLSTAVMLQGCMSTTEVKSTSVTPVIQEREELPETMLLDVGIKLFDPGLAREEDESDEDEIVFAEIRHAESRYFSYLLMETIQQSAAWGAVRVVPSSEAVVDVLVDGTILQSDGEILSLEISVQDATGKHWFTRQYEDKSSRYAYDRRNKVDIDPFQDVYNRIANDILNYRRSLAMNELATIHTVAELKFAAMFSPQAFEPYLRKDEDGLLVVVRLPSEQDPMFNRIRQIRERDYLYIDTLQEYYGGFARTMKLPYQQWRKESYSEVMAMRALQRSADRSKITGIAAVLTGVLAMGKSNSQLGRAAGSVAAAAGSYITKSGFDKEAEAQIHVEALQELGDSLEASIEPQVIELEDRTVTLTGTVENQYKQWREILHDIYKLDSTAEQRVIH